MKTLNLAINGTEKKLKDINEAVHPMLELKKSIQVSGTVRGVSNRNELQLDPTDLVELIFDDDTKWLCPPDSLEDIYPGSLTKNRDGESFLEMPSELEHPDVSRGLLGNVVLKVFNVFAKKKVGDAMEVLAKDLEAKQVGSFPGIAQINSNFEFKNPEGLNNDAPFILFIHGTNSSTTGSFGELVGTELWTYITQTYGPNILGFQHATLTKSPLQNALELIKQLPDNATLHVITHSRGGLVGEVLCRFSGATGVDAGFSKQEINLLTEEGRTEDVKYIKQLQEVYAAKNFCVKKFIRVACPSSGTTILSKRLDYFFNISLNLLGAIPALALSPIYAAMKNLLIALVDQKNDINVLPGLEAMKPDSPFIAVLNNQSSAVSIGEPVVAISGNCTMKANLKALVIIASKLFFSEPNDLIVNTKSMYNGSRRKEKLQFFFDEGADVDHFHYFKNKKTNGAIMLALKYTGTGTIDGFTEHSRGTLGVAERNAVLNLDGGQFSTGIPSGNKPIVILLPGIMGSNISQDDDLIWINYLRFLTGGLTRIAFDAKNTAAPSIIKTSYKKLADALQGTYDVVAFPFDWRMSMEQAAGAFNDTIISLMKLNKPIKIVGHSMGGVLVRDFMVYHPDTWKTLNASEGFRLLFLGSPLRGSYRINNVLFGEDDIISKISKIDIVHSKRKLVAMFAQFPGLLALLPFNTDPDNDFADIAVWQKMKDAFGDSAWLIPSDKFKPGLSDFKTYRDKVLNANSIDYTNAVYIAGQYKSTPCGYRIDETVRGKELVFLSTGEGDQSVTWEMGIPKEMINANTVYYVNFSHGALSNAPDIFNGIKEILLNGQTGLLSKNRPVIRGDKKIFKRPETPDFDLSPEGIENTILGISADEEININELPIKVKVSNGDLKYASYPLLAGHFKNDSILYAEARIDNLLQGLLNEQYKIGSYPGEIGSYEIQLTHQTTSFPGAIIVGLGEPDKLTAFELTRSIEQGVVKYLLNLNGQERIHFPIPFKEPLGISSLIIGCGYGGLSVEHSVTAILQGIINANTKISSLQNDNTKQIEVVEFIELYEDKALNCIYSIQRISNDTGGAINITPDSNKINILGGSRKQMNVDQDSDWWNRITIIKEKNKKDEIKGMRFTISTGAAREDLRIIYTSTGVVEKLVESISTDNNWSKERARAIFELLIPNDFKSRLKKHGNISWLLDDYTAGFPWELLQDNTPGAKPLSVNAGMIRQLTTANSRLNIEAVSENAALVIGDPDTKGFLPALPGALEEAKMVAQLLNDEGFNTIDLMQESPETIVPALVSSNYKIIHLAGHGIFDADPDKPSGMVIGENNYLTTAEIAQMSTTPELVFVNCCFLGKTDGIAEEFFQSRFKLAANIGTQLINNGVKAVVVAGWAVDDAAAYLFSKKFYENMFQGKTFGDAVRGAREEVYINYNRKNTWGAYQCYGDPFYKIRERKGKTVPKNYILSEQAEIDLSNLHSDLKTGDFNTESALAKLLSITEEVDKKDIRTPAITEQEAMIYKALNIYDKAIKKFEELLTSKNASYSFIAVEQFCNLRVKHIKSQLDKLGKKMPPKDLKTEFEKVVSDLRSLISLSPSAERYSLMGSAWKRGTVFYKTNKTKTIATLIEAARNYYLAFAEDKTGEDVYAYTNWVTLANILVIITKQNWGEPVAGDNKGHDAVLPEWQAIQDTLKSMERNQKENTDSNNYSEKIAISNIKLCAWMLSATKDKSIKKMPDAVNVKESYLNVWKEVGTKEEKEIEIQHLELIAETITIVAPKHFMLSPLKQLLDKLNAAI